MMREMPFPIPRSVICSPSHMIKAVPVVRVSMVRSRKPQPGSGMRARPPGEVCRSMKMAMPNDWMMEMPIVP